MLTKFVSASDEYNEIELCIEPRTRLARMAGSARIVLPISESSTNRTHRTGRGGIGRNGPKTPFLEKEILSVSAMRVATVINQNSMARRRLPARQPVRRLLGPQLGAEGHDHILAFGGPGSMPPPFNAHATTYPTVTIQDVSSSGMYICIYKCIAPSSQKIARFGEGCHEDG